MIPSATRSIYEAQATACLEAAERHRVNLLAVACRYGGSAEAGMDLFQQTCLNCHDAIQKRGFAGGRYEFYLLVAIKNLHFSEAKKKKRFEPLPPELAMQPHPEPAGDSHAVLAEQLGAEAREQFSPSERVALRLHAEGYSCQQIVEMTNGWADRRRLWERLRSMKAYLRATFQQAWDGLAE